MRILIVEDQPDAARVLAKALREQAYAVDIAPDGDAAYESATHNDYDVIVLDVMLPKRDGYSVCRELRRDGSAVPILMLTAKDAVESRVNGLDVGADDYLVKPFDLRELLARVRALARRGVRPPLPDAIAVGNLRFDVRARQVLVGSDALRLTTKEYALLEFFARRSGAVISRGEIAEHVWDHSYDAFSNVIDVYVQRLRRKLAEAGATSGIETRRGEGYRLIVLGGEAS